MSCGAARAPTNGAGSTRDLGISLAGRRTAIAHDWFQGFHGSERVVETLREALAGAGSPPDVFTFHAARELLPPELARAIVRESRLASLPGLRQRGHERGRWRMLLPVMARFFAALPLEPYDVVISSSHAFAANVRTRRGALHVCYCYTPLRYAWLPEVDRRGRRAGSAALRPVRAWLRRADRRAAARPDAYVAVSTAVRDRIRSFYGRDATVIHPPVDVDGFDPGAAKDPGHFLWVHRLVGYKNPHLVAEAFRGLPYRLTMVGVGPLERSLRRNLPANVELRGWVSQDELVRLHAAAGGFIHAAEEDFGISTVEALASGTPVIALARGGARDIVRDGVDGLLLEKAGVAELRTAVERLVLSTWDREGLAARAGAFSRERFLARFGAYLAERLDATLDGARA